MLQKGRDSVFGKIPMNGLTRSPTRKGFRLSPPCIACLCYGKCQRLPFGLPFDKQMNIR